ncbi:hypothetical protein HPB52_010085 [Rhipicephalus sanguineus]|uniref:Uncharacterized protein n=1 Tax=Rhipicephalus sanguineus TaxID=34632 RepID=A0A9D4PLX8_RHISA|nr:hypothetical protein HPB52_010085 [Rhipicephalus sanguineus]
MATLVESKVLRVAGGRGGWPQYGGARKTMLDLVEAGNSVCVGDDVDHILEFSAQHPNLMEVDRVTLLATHHERVTDKGRFQVRLRCQRRLVIEKYADED